MKKLLALLMALVIIASATTGCGGSNEALEAKVDRLEVRISKVEESRDDLLTMLQTQLEINQEFLGMFKEQYEINDLNSERIDLIWEAIDIISGY